MEKVVDLPQAQFLNGATVLSRREGTLLVADSALGSVFRVSTRSKEVKVVIKDPLFDICVSGRTGTQRAQLPQGRALFHKHQPGPSWENSHPACPRLKQKHCHVELLWRMILRSEARAGISLLRMCLISCLLFLLVGGMHRCWWVRMTGLGSRDRQVLPSEKGRGSWGEGVCI